LTRATPNGFAPRIAIFPIVARPAFHDPAWREQFDRECAAKLAMRDAPPPRTRPMLALSNEITARPMTFAEYFVLVGKIADALREEG
jgi:hypothetical protein